MTRIAIDTSAWQNCQNAPFSPQPVPFDGGYVADHGKEPAFLNVGITTERENAASLHRPLVKGRALEPLVAALPIYRVVGGPEQRAIHVPLEDCVGRRVPEEPLGYGPGVWSLGSDLFDPKLVFVILQMVSHSEFPWFQPASYADTEDRYRL